MPLAPDLQNTRRERVALRPPVVECHDETTCLRPNASTGHKVSPDTTESKTPQVELQRTPQPTSANQKRKTKNTTKATAAEQPRAHQSETIETMEGPETTSITLLARDRQHTTRPEMITNRSSLFSIFFLKKRISNCLRDYVL